MSRTLSILLADDHSLVRKGFRRLLEDDPGLRIAGEAGNGVDAVRLARQLLPDIVVMDLSMPELDGIQATREITKALPLTRVVILSMYPEESYVRNAIESGASGYMLKSAADLDLARAIRLVAAGQRFLSPGLRYSPVAVVSDEDERYERLTQREKQILQMIAQGRSNKEIAALLALSVNTVNVHRANMMEKMNIHRTTELVLYAVRRGLVAPT